MAGLDREDVTEAVTRMQELNTQLSRTTHELAGNPRAKTSVRLQDLREIADQTSQTSQLLADRLDGLRLRWVPSIAWIGFALVLTATAGVGFGSRFLSPSPPPDTTTTTTLSGSTWTAVLDGTDLRSADLEGAELRNASLVGTCLRFASLDNAVLDGADIAGADLRGASLLNVDLSTTSGVVVVDTYTILDNAIVPNGGLAADRLIQWQSDTPTACG